ncbi:hypothetical protein OC842_006889 [Tilletia horrida]|uniref:Ricin B lectin domain-containing protein n=1 Tax=Tilletia horrida TaxID=155126 RepID=A0AAN6JH94_9BASI|nr:hypothetical protein OC842_006889 [Tilletia horrida]
MHAASLLAVASAFLLATSAQAASLEARQSQLSCQPPSVGKLVSTGPSGVPRAVAFQSARDPSGNRLLSTSVGSTPATTNKDEFRFQRCFSSNLPSEPVVDASTGAVTSFGRVQVTSNIKKCITATSFGQAGKANSLISTDCRTTDSTALIDQWFALTTVRLPSDSNGNPVYRQTLNFAGRYKNEPKRNYGWTNVAENNARLVKTVLSEDPKASTGYTLTFVEDEAASQT